MWRACAQIKPTMMVPAAPTAKPAFLKAKGIASTPDPSDAFNKWARAPALLEN